MFSVRDAAPGDAPGIAEVHVAGWRAAYRGRLPDAFLDGLRPAQRLPMWTRLLAAPSRRGVILVAEAGGRIVGFASAGPTRDEDQPGAAELYAIYLLPARWGRGVGAALFTACSERLAARGFERLGLWVLDDNPRARRFYARMGLRPDGHEKQETLGGLIAIEVRYSGRIRHAQGG